MEQSWGWSRRDPVTRCSMPMGTSKPTTSITTNDALRARKPNWSDSSRAANIASMASEALSHRASIKRAIVRRLCLFLAARSRRKLARLRMLLGKGVPQDRAGDLERR